MNKLQCITKKMEFSNYITLEGALQFKEAHNFKMFVTSLITRNKDLYIDIKGLNKIDVLGLSLLIKTMKLVNDLGGDFFILVSHGNPIYRLMDEMQLNNQSSFRDSFIQDSGFNIAS